MNNEAAMLTFFSEKLPDLRLCAIRSGTAEHRRMHNSDYYREEAARYRELAERAKDAAMKQELLELAEACEAIADNIDDLRASG